MGAVSCHDVCAKFGPAPRPSGVSWPPTDASQHPAAPPRLPDGGSRTGNTAPLRRAAAPRPGDAEPLLRAARVRTGDAVFQLLGGEPPTGDVASSREPLEFGQVTLYFSFKTVSLRLVTLRLTSKSINFSLLPLRFGLQPVYIGCGC